MSYEWKDTYSIGFSLIDEQHKKVFGLLNELNKAHKMGISQHSVKEALNSLIDYTIYHFKAEEGLLKKYHYPKIKQQIDEHHAFTLKMISFREDAKSGNLILILKLIDYIKDWWITHILGTDQEFASFVHSKELD